MFGLNELLLCPDGPTTVAVGVHHTRGVQGLAKTVQGLLMLGKSTLEQSVLEIHRPEVVAKLAFELQDFCSLFARLQRFKALQELFGGLFRLALLAQAQTLFIKGLGLSHPFGLGVASGQQATNQYED